MSSANKKTLGKDWWCARRYTYCSTIFSFVFISRFCADFFSTGVVCARLCQTSAKQETNLSYFAFTFLRRSHECIFGSKKKKKTEPKAKKASDRNNFWCFDVRTMHERNAEMRNWHFFYLKRGREAGKSTNDEAVKKFILDKLKICETR